LEAGSGIQLPNGVVFETIGRSLSSKKNKLKYPVGVVHSSSQEHKRESLATTAEFNRFDAFVEVRRDHEGT
jgi:hypothetical protein